MTADLTTRKPIVQITPEDLQQYPIWEYTIDEEDVEGQDETWIRPVNRKTVPRNAYSQIVASKFTTRAGHELAGFMIVTTAHDEADMMPGAIVGEHGYACLPSVNREEAIREELGWAVESRDDVVHALRSEEGDVFPMDYQLQARVSGEKVLREGQVV